MECVSETEMKTDKQTEIKTHTKKQNDSSGQDKMDRVLYSWR